MQCYSSLKDVPPAAGRTMRPVTADSSSGPGDSEQPGAPGCQLLGSGHQHTANPEAATRWERAETADRATVEAEATSRHLRGTGTLARGSSGNFASHRRHCGFQWVDLKFISFRFTVSIREDSDHAGASQTVRRVKFRPNQRVFLGRSGKSGVTVTNLPGTFEFLLQKLILLSVAMLRKTTTTRHTPKPDPQQKATWRNSFRVSGGRHSVSTRLRSASLLTNLTEQQLVSWSVQGNKKCLRQDTDRRHLAGSWPEVVIGGQVKQVQEHWPIVWGGRGLEPETPTNGCDL